RREVVVRVCAGALPRLEKADAPDVLAQQAAFVFVRSVRHKPRANRSPRESSPGGMTDARWRNGYAELGRNNLRFDLQTPWWHLAEAARLANDFPDTPVILNHTGLPADRSAEGIACWEAAMNMPATGPNATLNIS